MTATGYYASQQDMVNIIGPDLLQQWSNIMGGDTIDEARVQNALNFADSRFNQAFLFSPYKSPLVASTGQMIPLQVTDAAAKFAIVWLYENRGQLDSLTNREHTEDGMAKSQQSTWNRMSGYKKEVERWLGIWKAGLEQLPCQRNKNQPTCPTPIPVGS